MIGFDGSRFNQGYFWEKVYVQFYIIQNNNFPLTVDNNDEDDIETQTVMSRELWLKKFAQICWHLF